MMLLLHQALQEQVRLRQLDRTDKLAMLYLPFEDFQVWV